MPGIKRPPSADAANRDVQKKRKHIQNDHGKGSNSKQSVMQELNGSTSSKEAHAKQKALARERKASKPNADSILRAKKLWDRLRRKSHVPHEERQKLVAELFDIISGNVKDYVFKHDSVRPVQCAIKYANKEQRKMIATELQGEFKSLAESRYGKFLVAKLLVAGDDETNEMIISEFYGHVRRMINHPEASWILDDTYRQVATSKQKALLLREWYGPEFSIFKSQDSDAPTADLTTILEQHPEKRKPIMSNLFGMINGLIQKKLTGFTMLHDAMLQYSLAIGNPSASDPAAEFIELLKGDEEGDLMKNLGFTKSGSRVVCRALALTTAKDRKLLLRPFKDNIVDLAYDANGHTILVTAFEVIDDTKLTSKAIISELLAAKAATSTERLDTIVTTALNPIARVPLLWPFATDSGATWLTGKDNHTMAILGEVRALRSETSKKEPETRRLELLSALSQDAILLSTIENRATQLMNERLGCQFIAEVLLGVDSGDKTAAMTAVADAAAANLAPDDPSTKAVAAGRMLKALVIGGRWDADKQAVVKFEPRLGFVDILYPRIKDQIEQWAMGKHSFIVTNMIGDEGFEEEGDLINKLNKHKKKLESVAAEGNKGAGILLDTLNGGGGGGVGLAR